MHRILGLVSVTAAVLMAAATASSAGAATGLSSVYVVAGVETSIPTNNTSTFAGGALGSSGDSAFWHASITHAALSSCPFGSTASCAITGGSFALTSSDGAQLAGSFTGGSVTPISQQTPCGKQVFGVSGALATTSGPATFTATLTHYRTFLFGTCVTYFATVTGSLQRA
jgi:hypothetical protein